MEMNRNEVGNRNGKLLAGFILVWVIVNLLQSYFTGLYADEAYYWVYSRNMQWGYFDHPPMVAAAIKLGDFFVHNALFTRLGTVLFSAGAIYFLHKALPDEFRNTKSFILSFLSVIVFHVYGFVATPDAALFFFTTLFFCAYKLYLKEESVKHSLFLGLCIVGLMYSKYHGVLPVFFTLLSNPKLILKRSAWLAVAIGVIGLLPHLYWQYLHDWPTFRYHLSERVASRYRISKTTSYIGGQILVWGPLTTLPVFYHFIKQRSGDVYLRAHAFTFWGVLIFFFFSSFKSAIEPHWTLVAGISFIVLLQSVLGKGSERFKKTFYFLALTNIVLACIVRVLLMVPGSPVSKVGNLKPIFFGKSWTDAVYMQANGSPVLFVDSYADPALYQYYHPDVITSGYNTNNYRKTHYNISDDEQKMNGKNVWLVTEHKIDSADKRFSNSFKPISLHRIAGFPAVNSLKIEWANVVKQGKKGSMVEAKIRLRNIAQSSILSPYKTTIGYTFFKTRKEKFTTDSNMPVNNGAIAPGTIKEYNVPLQLPNEAGKFKLLFSVVMPPFAGTLASPFYEIEVE
jgi:hypothetical protein